jgi:PhzF family phenazine biosynthesis protein
MIRVVHVDAFTAQPFAGNPAAVCVLPGPREEAWMQDVAREMNLSDTAFLYPHGNGFDLRWFTPKVEIALCGHATLASAHVLWEDAHLARRSPARFRTKSGLLTAVERDGWIEMDFPAVPNQSIEAPRELLQALGLQNGSYLYAGKNEFDYLIEVASEATLRALDPDHSALRRLPVRGVIVTARGSDYDFVSRFFAPGVGIDEAHPARSSTCRRNDGGSFADLRALLKSAEPRGENDQQHDECNQPEQAANGPAQPPPLTISGAPNHGHSNCPADHELCKESLDASRVVALRTCGEGEPSCASRVLAVSSVCLPSCRLRWLELPCCWSCCPPSGSCPRCVTRSTPRQQCAVSRRC